MTFPEFTTMPIAGDWRAGRAGKTSADDLDEAFRGAAAAQRDWAAATPADRAAVLLAAASVMERRKDEITGWLIRESGGTLAKAELEWQLVHAVMLEAASMPHHVAGLIMPSDIPGKESRVYRRLAGSPR
jgi:aldehyde dehydrogenase (NAD+)